MMLSFFETLTQTLHEYFSPPALEAPSGQPSAPLRPLKSFQQIFWDKARPPRVSSEYLLSKEGTDTVLIRPFIKYPIEWIGLHLLSATSVISPSIRSNLIKLEYFAWLSTVLLIAKQAQLLPNLRPLTLLKLVSYVGVLALAIKNSSLDPSGIVVSMVKYFTLIFFTYLWVELTNRERVDNIVGRRPAFTYA